MKAFILDTDGGCRSSTGWRRSFRVGGAESNSEQVNHVVPVSAQQLQAAVAVVAPANTHLLDPITAQLSEIKDLDIEHVAVNPLAAEQVAGHCRAEELEAALRVANIAQAHQPVHGQTEEA